MIITKWIKIHSRRLYVLNLVVPQTVCSGYFPDRECSILISIWWGAEECSLCRFRTIFQRVSVFVRMEWGCCNGGVPFYKFCTLLVNSSPGTGWYQWLTCIPKGTTRGHLLGRFQSHHADTKDARSAAGQDVMSEREGRNRGCGWKLHHGMAYWEIVNHSFSGPSERGKGSWLHAMVLSAEKSWSS